VITISSEYEGKWDDNELVMISALEHYSYCPRQCALIHVEQTYEENIYTLRGSRAHERVDEPYSGIEEGIRVERALPLWSERLGLVGKADVVEFHGDTPYPVEYKHGRRRAKEHDDVQLCAQAICLEEMTGTFVPKGAIYYFSSRRRREVTLDNSLRIRVEELTNMARSMLKNGETPPAKFDKRCKNCSLLQSCLPEIVDVERKQIWQVWCTLFDAMED
jgi:CRISPR-associated exonuclease Cas4